MQSEQTNLCRFDMSLSLYIHKLIILHTETYSVYVGLVHFLNIFLRENISGSFSWFFAGEQAQCDLMGG